MILMYHKVAPEAKTMWWVDIDNFYRQMIEIQSKQVVYLDDYDPYNIDHVVITFDGVYENIYQYALPILEKFGYVFELFVTSDYIGKKNTFDTIEPEAKFASIDTLKLLVKGGGRVQWHSKTHKNMLNMVDQDEIVSELKIPNKLINLDKNGFSWFGYPHGEFNKYVLDETKKYFKGAISCNQGNDNDLYMLNRITVESRTSFRTDKISIIIPSYNYGSFLAESIESVLHQTILPDEIIIIDDGSTDNTELVGILYEKRYPHLIKFIQNKKNLGIIKTFNKAVNLSSGDYICFIGADNRIVSNYIEEVSSELDKDKTIGIAYTDFALFGPRAKEEYSRFREEYQGKIKNGFYIINFPNFNEKTKLILETQNFIHGSSMYRKEAFDAIGGYQDNEGKPEDHNLFLRMIKDGWNAKRIEKPLLEYRQHSEDQANIKVQMKEELKFFKKEFLPLLNKKESEVLELNETLNTKDSQIIDLNKTVNTKDSQIIELSEHVNRKDAQVIEVNTLAHTQQDTIQTMAQTIDKLHSQINTLTTKLQNDIDISIVTYNSKKWIDTFFESLLKQNYPLKKIHLYITDNNSTDDTYVYLQSLNTKYSNIFATFDLKQEKNLGFGFGHNNNFKRSHSQFVLATNIDLQFEEDAITNLVRYAQTDDRTTASWEMRQKPYEHPKYYNPITFETTWSSSACILFRKEAINKIGGYDDHIFMYGEDVELSYRLRDNGYKLKYYPKAVCWHYTYAEAGEIKEVQYFGSTIANVLIRMRYGNKTEIKEGLRMYKGLLNTQGLIYNQRRKQLIYLFKLMYKAPFFLLNRKKRRDINYKFINWDYEFIRDGAFYNYTEEKLTDIPLVSVIMRTCCERNEFLKEAIQSVINQTYTNIELVVVEDGSDNAKEIIENIIATNLTNIIYKPIEKAGRCHAGNEGLASAHGKYMIFLDDDDLFFADHLEVLVNELEKNPDTAACYSSSFEVKTDVISKLPLQYKEKEFTIIHKEEFSRETMLHHNYIPIQSILFKRELYLRYGGFDEELDNLEDWNLWTRYSYLNNFKFIDKTTSLYRVPSCPDSSAKRQKELDRYYQIALEKQKKFIQSL